ncbi:MAG TPA: TasA family protein [Acidimicrobiales bacterium]|nr:TasA family protein [Acidimicrobiales bacterium]
MIITIGRASKHASKSRWGRRALAGGFALSVLGLTGAGVYAGLNATATSTSAVTSGTLLMTLSADAPSAGLPETISNMAPGDVYNVYVNVNNTGTLASAAGMTLGAAASPVNALTNGSVSGEGLSVSITQCSVAWVAGSCSLPATTTTILASTPLSSFGSAQSLSNVPSLAATSGSLAHLQFSVTLAGTETSNNGTLPAQTIQGLTTTITWTFTELQRTATTTNA